MSLVWMHSSTTRLAPSHKDATFLPTVFKSRRTVRSPSVGCTKVHCIDSTSCHSKQQVELHGPLSFSDSEDYLADRAIRAWRRSDEDEAGKRVLIGVCGVPGSGKTTTTGNVTAKINKLLGQDIAVVVPMDGFHLYRAELDAMSSPNYAHARRGAPFTFDVRAFIQCVAKIHAHAGQVRAPSFDHTLGDPCPGGVVVEPYHEIVLIEGIHVLLEQKPWCELQQYFDDSWFLGVDLDLAMANVRLRQMDIGDRSPDMIDLRVATNDRPNAELVQGSKHRADVILDMTPALQHAVYDRLQSDGSDS